MLLSCEEFGELEMVSQSRFVGIGGCRKSLTLESFLKLRVLLWMLGSVTL